MFGKRSDEERTTQDRARAAAERAARRAGRPLPPETFEDAVRPPDVEPRVTRVEREPEPVAEAAPEPVEAPEPDPQPTAEYTPFETDEQPAQSEPHFAGEQPAQSEPRFAGGQPAQSEPRFAGEQPARPEPRFAGEQPAQSEPHFAGGQPAQSEPRFAGEQPADREPRFAREQSVHPESRSGDERPQPRLVAAHRLAAEDAPRETAEHEFEPDPEPEPLPPPTLRPAPERREPPRRRPAPPNPRRRRPPAAPPRSRGGSGGHWARRIVALIALILIAVALFVINGVFQPFHGDGAGAVQVSVPQGATAGQIGDLLAAKGVVDNATLFEINATVTGRRGKLRPGHYVMLKGMKNGAVIDMLTTPPKARKPPPTVNVTFTEGPSRKEMAPFVDRSKKVDGSYLKATSTKAVLKRIHRLGAPKGVKTPEGFLFPATYTLTAGSSARQLVAKQLDAFAQNFRRVDLRYARSKHLTRYDVLTIASMIEREVEVPRERPLVAAVIYNRLREGMPLGIDATIRYYTNNWQRPIRQSELDADEPYNTERRRGLPPTPIGNPGLASLKAAAHPAHKPYLFYVRKPGKSGEHAFSSTDAQFERDRARYEAARNGR